MQGLDIYAITMALVFAIGYLFITIEHITKISKTTVALIMAVTLWVLQIANSNCPSHESLECLGFDISEIAQIVFFILGAMTIVEIISMHKGFKVISDFITVASKRKLLWVIGFLAFFLSSILDNLTTTIVIISLLRKLIPNKEDLQDRLIIGGAVVIAANAGGAWTPIGDVTTTMLWIGGQLSTGAIMYDLFLPSIVCLIVALAFLTPMLKGKFAQLEEHHQEPLEPLGKIIFYLGIALLMFVPVFKVLTGLPPFMGVLFGVGVLWCFTDIMHAPYDEREHLRIPYALSKIDLSSSLFFLGILLSVSALGAAHLLTSLASWLDHVIGNTTVVATLIGLASAVIDNVPLVAASMGMYTLESYPMNSQFWLLVAYCAGTGGSVLIIGSAAGVVFMGMEKVDFFWFCRKISLAALAGYFAGIFVYLLV